MSLYISFGQIYKMFSLAADGYLNRSWVPWIEYFSGDDIKSMNNHVLSCCQQILTHTEINL